MIERNVEIELPPNEQIAFKNVHGDKTATIQPPSDNHLEGASLDFLRSCASASQTVTAMLW